MLGDLELEFSMMLQLHDRPHMSHDTVTVTWSQWKNIKGSSTMMLYRIFNIC